MDGAGAGQLRATRANLYPNSEIVTYATPLCGDGRIKTANQIKCLDGGDRPAATPHIGREQRELVFDVALPVEYEVRSAEGAVVARGFVPH